MSSRKYYICKPFFERDESHAQVMIDEEQFRIEELMNEYNLLDPNYMHYIESDPYDRYYYDDYYVEEDPNDWYDGHAEYIAKFKEDLVDININDNIMKATFDFVFASEIRSFKNCWKEYTKTINNNCLSIYVAPFVYFNIPMPDILRELSTYEEFTLDLVLLNKDELDRLPYNLKDISNKFLYCQYLITHKEPRVIELLNEQIQIVFEKLISNFSQNNRTSKSLEDLGIDINHHDLFTRTSQKVRIESLFNKIDNDSKQSHIKKKI